MVRWGHRDSCTMKAMPTPQEEGGRRWQIHLVLFKGRMLKGKVGGGEVRTQRLLHHEGDAYTTGGGGQEMTNTPCPQCRSPSHEPAVAGTVLLPWWPPSPCKTLMCRHDRCEMLIPPDNKQTIQVLINQAIVSMHNIIQSQSCKELNDDWPTASTT